MSVRILPLLILGAAFSGACEDDYNDPARPGADARPGAEVRPANEADRRATPDNDNTAMNKVDQKDGTLTPMDQAENSADIQITANVRKQILAAENLSTNADNVKIITSGGVVTLRGVVNSQDEKGWVEGIAKGVEGVTRVDNQLELNLQ